MSLLMDALKRAEREREARAARERGEARESEGSQSFSLEDTTAAEPAPGGAAPDDRPLELEREGAQPAGDRDPGDFRPGDLGPGDLGDETASTMPSMKAVQASVERYFDGSQSSSMSLDSMSAEAIEDEATTVVGSRRRAGGDQAAARTVFDAKKVKRRSSSAWAWALLVPLVLLALGGGGYYYWQNLTPGPSITGPTAGVAPPPRASPSPTQPSEAAGVAATAPGDGSGQAQAGGQTQTGGQAQAGLAGDGSGETAAGGQAVAEQPAQGAGATGEQPAVAAQVPAGETPGEVGGEASLAEAAPSVADEPPVRGDLSPAEPEIEDLLPSLVPEPEAPPEELLASAEQRIAEALAGEGQLVGGGLRDESLDIRRRTVPSRVDPVLSEAYGAYRRNDLAAAERGYRQVLEREPRNRDALLGLAAVAARSGRDAAALTLYSRVLRLYPRDSVALAGLMGLQQNLDPVASESRIKLLLEREPNAEHLHFSLGNLYAQQSRWAEAEQAYFNAYRLRSDNPDYAFNLAVGLDHLAKREAALTYYRRALELAASRPASFDPEAVRRRIESMTGQGS